MFGPWQLGFMQLSHYVQKHIRVAQAMWKVDPSLKLIGVGSLGEFNRRNDPEQKVGWTEGMLADCAALGRCTDSVKVWADALAATSPTSSTDETVGRNFMIVSRRVGPWTGQAPGTATAQRRITPENCWEPRSGCGALAPSSSLRQQEICQRGRGRMPAHRW